MAVAALLLVSASFAGCSATSNITALQETPTPSAEPAQASPLATYPGSPTGMDAAFHGTLRVVDGCLGLGGPAGLSEVLVFASDSASWNDGVLTWKGEQYRDGDPISGGGGHGSTTDGYLPTGCLSLPTWLVGA